MNSEKYVISNTLEKEIEHDDEYDAIAVGVTHLARYRP